VFQPPQAPLGPIEEYIAGDHGWRANRSRIVLFVPLPSLLYGNDWGRFGSGSRRKLGHAREDIECDVLLSYGKDDASGFLVRSDYPMFLFGNGSDLLWCGGVRSRHESRV